MITTMTQYKNLKFDVPGISVHIFHTCLGVEHDLPCQGINYAGPNFGQEKLK